MLDLLDILATLIGCVPAPGRPRPPRLLVWLGRLFDLLTFKRSRNRR